MSQGTGIVPATYRHSINVCERKEEERKGREVKGRKGEREERKVLVGYLWNNSFPGFIQEADVRSVLLL